MVAVLPESSETSGTLPFSILWLSLSCLLVLFQNGETVLAKEDLVCPPGWYFIEDWHVEVNRAVDDDGKSPI